MIQFNKLRLSGFKSFVDKTELEIGPGLNGIVGPNGCGKSNLVEALRWVMGESSAKKMRGDGMEDVIFAGTDKRSARNIAEVTLLLDNSSRRAPPQYNSSDEIEVTRKIERDRGSDYRINGKLARARDVQMLFADTVTGSNSPALVSQGHVTRMINAKPQDRRLILEESAGISGLYARRHEAEIRLKAADTNLLRLVDIVGGMETRLASLKRQARQAAKYRNLSAQIRQFELVITHLEWLELIEKRNKAREEFATIDSEVANKIGAVTQLTRTQTTQAEELPALRRKEADIAAKLQTKKIALQRLEDETLRHKETLQELKNQVHQARVDQQHEEKMLEENENVISKIQIEHDEITKNQSKEPEKNQELTAIKDILRDEVKNLEERFTSLKESAAERRANIQSLAGQIKNNQSQLALLISRKKQAEDELSKLESNDELQKQIKDTQENILKHEQILNEKNKKLESLRSEIKNIEMSTETARSLYNEHKNKLAKFDAEIVMLERFFKNETAHSFVPVLDKITTKQGFEKSLSRALGDSLVASLDTDAPARWKLCSTENNLPILPDNVESLLSYIIDYPDELKLCLSQIGFVHDEEAGNALQDKLLVGQSLVSSDGTYWRWDGYFVKAIATDRNAVYLEQKNKLKELKTLRDLESDVLSQAEANFLEAQNKEKSTKKEQEELYINIKDNESTLTKLRPALTKLQEKGNFISGEYTRLEGIIKTSEEDILKLESSINEQNISLTALETSLSGSEGEEIDTVKKELEIKKDALQDAIRNLDLFIQNQNTQRARLQAIADERINLQNRNIRAKSHLDNIVQRLETLEKKLADIKAQPKNYEKEQQELVESVAEYENERRQAALFLESRESELAQTTKALRDAENSLNNSRENRARIQAIVGSIEENVEKMRLQIEETLQLRPQEILKHAAMDMVQYKIDDLSRLKSEKESIVRERDLIGPVNLRAEQETETLEKELTTLLHERNDLIQAIDELRGGIAKINKEARERLLGAFDHVNAHFKNLFLRLFGGGNAYLKLIDSEDPLGAGLEIFAQPPGKALQSLSLLSGGEQTLASIALIFGMFLTNPSPICVLDEIDAPLDDANVDRVCDLLDEIAARGETRFLIITHHRLSMARMDRLYGVTMSEKGISQIVSVDMQQTFDFIDKQVA